MLHIYVHQPHGPAIALADGTRHERCGVRYRSPYWNRLHWLASSNAGAGNDAVFLENLRLSNANSK